MRFWEKMAPQTIATIYMSQCGQSSTSRLFVAYTAHPAVSEMGEELTIHAPA
jgi:hypothetical protein